MTQHTATTVREVDPHDDRAERERLVMLLAAAWPDGPARYHRDLLFHSSVDLAVQLLMFARAGDDTLMALFRSQRTARS